MLPELLSCWARDGFGWPRVASISLLSPFLLFNRSVCLSSALGGGWRTV